MDDIPRIPAGFHRERSLVQRIWRGLKLRRQQDGSFNADINRRAAANMGIRKSKQNFDFEGLLDAFFKRISPGFQEGKLK